MARVVIDGLDLVVQLGALERVGALNGDVRTSVAQVQRAWVAQDPWRELRGLRAPGTGIPWVIMLGTMRGSFGKDFCAVYGRASALVIELTGASFSRWVLTLATPEAVAARIMSARHGGL